MACVMLTGCVALNADFDDPKASASQSSVETMAEPETTSGADASGKDSQATSGPTTTPTTTSGSLTSGAGSTHAGPTGGDTSDDTGGELPLCEPRPGFDLSFEHDGCDGEGRFIDVVACSNRTGTKNKSVDAIGIRPAIGCNLDDAVCGWGVGAEIVPLEVAGVPIRDAILGGGHSCGPMWLVGAADDGNCRYDGVFLFDDDPSHELLVGFANVSDGDDVLPMLLAGLTPFATPLADGGECGPPEPGCAGAGELAVQLGSAVAFPGEPAELTEITLPGPGGGVTQDVFLFNLGLRRDEQCHTQGAWAVVRPDLSGVLRSLE